MNTIAVKPSKQASKLVTIWQNFVKPDLKKILVVVWVNFRLKDQRERKKNQTSSYFICFSFLQGLFIFLIYGVYNTEVSPQCISRLTEWVREMTWCFWWDPHPTKGELGGCWSEPPFAFSFFPPRERPTALHAWAHLYASRSTIKHWHPE